MESPSWGVVPLSRAPSPWLVLEYWASDNLKITGKLSDDFFF